AFLRDIFIPIGQFVDEDALSAEFERPRFTGSGGRGFTVPPWADFENLPTPVGPQLPPAGLPDAEDAAGVDAATESVDNLASSVRTAADVLADLNDGMADADAVAE